MRSLLRGVSNGAISVDPKGSWSDYDGGHAQGLGEVWKNIRKVRLDGIFAQISSALPALSSFPKSMISGLDLHSLTQESKG